MVPQLQISENFLSNLTSTSWNKEFLEPENVFKLYIIGNQMKFLDLEMESKTEVYELKRFISRRFYEIVMASSNKFPEEDVREFLEEIQQPTRKVNPLIFEELLLECEEQGLLVLNIQGKSLIQCQSCENTKIKGTGLKVDSSIEHASNSVAFLFATPFVLSLMFFILFGYFYLVTVKYFGFVFYLASFSAAYFGFKVDEHWDEHFRMNRHSKLYPFLNHKGKRFASFLAVVVVSFFFTPVSSFLNLSSVLASWFFSSGVYLLHSHAFLLNYSIIVYHAMIHAQLKGEKKIDVKKVQFFSLLASGLIPCALFFVLFFVLFFIGPFLFTVVSSVLSIFIYEIWREHHRRHYRKKMSSSDLVEQYPGTTLLLVVTYLIIGFFSPFVGSSDLFFNAFTWFLLSIIKTVSFSLCLFAIDYLSQKFFKYDILNPVFNE